MADVFNPRDAQLSPVLTNLVPKYPGHRLIREEIANVTTVTKEAGTYWFMRDNGVLDRRTSDGKAPGAESHAAALDWTTDTYATKTFALHTVLPDDTRETADSQLGLEVEHAALARDAVLLDMELRAGAHLFSATTFANYTAAATEEWDGTIANVRLWNDILGAAFAIVKTCGREATDVAMNMTSWYAIAKYVMLQTGTPAGIRWSGVADLLNERPNTIPASFLGFRLHVGMATYSSGTERPADVTRTAAGLTEVWPEGCLVYHKGSSGVKSMQLCTDFRVKGYPKVRRGRLSNTSEGDWFEYKVRQTENPKVVCTPCGYFISANLS